MKKIKNLFWVLTFAPLIGLTVLQSCKGNEPEDTNPTISVSPEAAQTVAAGETVTYQIIAGAQEGLSRLTISPSVNGNPGGNVLDTVLTGNNRTFSYDYRVSSASQANDNIQLTFTVTDAKNQTARTVRTVTVGTSGSVREHSNITLGAQNNANTGSFFSTSTGNVWKVAEARNNQAQVDFIYFHGATNQATLAAPDDNSFGTGGSQIGLGVHEWTTRNATRFKMANGVNFNNTTSPSQLEQAYNSATVTETTRANMLANGNIVAFKTAAGKHGLIRVNSVSGTTSGSINIDVKVQQ